MAPTQPVPMPPRSRLYGLAPQGVGTSYVEGLASYVPRLAQAHGLTTSGFIVQELADLFAHQRKVRSGYTRKEYIMTSNLWSQGQRLNGPTDTADTAVRLLTHKTGGIDLQPLTLLAWRSVVSTKRLMRDRKAWCPYCYQDMRDGGISTYDLLAWSLASVTMCLRHGTPLVTVCPHALCHRHVPILGGNAPPGWCPSCRGWLGRPWEVEDVWACGAVSRFDTWQARGVAALLRGIPSTPVAQQPRRMRRNVGVCVRAMTDGQRALFCQRLGIRERTLYAWGERSCTITLSDALVLCGVLTVSPLLFLDEDVQDVATGLSVNPAMSFDPHRLPNTTRTRAMDRRPLSTPEAVRAALLAIVSDDMAPPPSWSAVARCLSCDRRTLRDRCPDLARIIVDRHRAFQQADRARRVADARVAIRAAVHHTAEDGRPPGLERVRRMAPSSTLLPYADIKDVYRQAVADLELAPDPSSP